MGRGARSGETASPSWMRRQPDWTPMSADQINDLALRVTRRCRVTFFTCPNTRQLDSAVTVLNRAFARPDGAEFEVTLAVGPSEMEGAPPRWMVHTIYDGVGRKRAVTRNDLLGSAADALSAFNARTGAQGSGTSGDRSPVTLTELQDRLRALAAS